MSQPTSGGGVGGGGGAPVLDGNTSTKLVTKRGIDGDGERNKREEKTVQIRKDKRSDRAAMQRRHVSITHLSLK